MNRNKILLVNNTTSPIEDTGIVTQYTYTGSTSILPTFTPTDYNYTVSDVTNSDGSTTRTIYSVDSVYPTKCKLNSSAITSIDYYKLSETETIDMTQAFSGCYNVTNINLSMLNTSNCLSFSEMCKDCKSVVNLDLSNFDMTNAQMLNSMFNGCLKLQTVNTTGWGQMPKVTRTHYMFYKCNSLTRIDGTDTWVLPAVGNASNMFYDNRRLSTLDLSSCTFASCTNMSNMIWGCNKLTQLKLNSSVIKSNCNVTNMMARVNPSCVVTVPSNFGKTESDCSFDGTFTIVVASVSLNKKTLTMSIGDTETLVATINPSNATNKSITWTSTKPKVAIVDGEGTVTALSEGNTNVIATTEDGNKTSTCKVTVQSNA